MSDDELFPGDIVRLKPPVSLLLLTNEPKKSQDHSAKYCVTNDELCLVVSTFFEKSVLNLHHDLWVFFLCSNGGCGWDFYNDFYKIKDNFEKIT